MANPKLYTYPSPLAGYENAPPLQQVMYVFLLTP